MKIIVTEVKPSFTIAVSCDELRLIEDALLNQGADVKSGDACNFTLWSAVNSLLEEAGISTLGMLA